MCFPLGGLCIFDVAFCRLIAELLERVDDWGLEVYLILTCLIRKFDEICWLTDEGSLEQSQDPLPKQDYPGGHCKFLRTTWSRRDRHNGTILSVVLYNLKDS